MLIFIVACTPSHKTVDKANLSDDIENKIQSQVQLFGTENKSVIGDELLLIIGNQIYTASYTEKVNNVAQAQDCTVSHCQEVQHQVNEVCKANGWQPGHKVLICDSKTGVCCNCYCK